jgi:hypothetical protein
MNVDGQLHRFGRDFFEFPDDLLFIDVVGIVGAAVPVECSFAFLR